MTNSYTTSPPPISNQELAAAQGKFGFGKIISALVVGAASTYLMNQLSLHGVNFEAGVGGVKIPSEMVKSAIDAGFDAFAVWATPAHFIAAIVDFIRWCKSSFKTIADAIKAPPT